MVYQVLARKWRPQLFEEIVGQDHIVRTLRNAISLGRIAHAYLFTGMRGTGKTSTARILAKALNCERGPTPSPCNECDNCKEIMRSESLDVLEIDGASNRGIDEIRELREKARFSPVKAKFKVYIIDEVHMLTNPAFNALLKILEEPPSYIVFIFATTDPHKLLPTIISRCQRFDFRKIPAPKILARLHQIAEKEEIKITKEALALIAEGAENSMRDAEKVLDQAVSYAEEEITEADVVDILGMVEKKYLFQLTQNIAEKSPLANIKLINQLLEEGRDPNWIIKEWQKWFRDLIILKMGGDDFLPEKQQVKPQVPFFTLTQLVHFMNLLSATKRKIVFSSQSQVDMELLMVELSSGFEAGDLSLKEPELVGIYQKILDLEKKLISGASFAEKKKVTQEVPLTAFSSNEQRATSNENVPTHIRQKKKEKGDERRATSDENASVDIEGEQKEKEKEYEDEQQKAEKMDGDTEFLKKWPLIIKEIEKRKKTLGIWLQKATLINIGENSATLGLKNGFHKETLTEKNSLRLMNEALKKFLPFPFALKYVLIKKEDKEERKLEESSSKSKWTEMVAKAIDIFEGEIVRR